MQAVLEAQRRALGAMQQVCARQPGVHGHQLRALQRELGLCASASSLSDYQRLAGGGFELARAAWLDRVAGRFHVAQAVGDRHAARAALAEYRGALAAQDLSVWTEALQAAAHAAAPWRERSAQAGSSLAATLLNLLLHHSCTPPQADHWGDAVGAWQTLCAADPAAAGALQAGAKWPARVAQRLPWRDGAARAWLQRLLAALPAPSAAALDDPSACQADEENADADLAVELSDLGAAWGRGLHDAAVSPVEANPSDPAGCSVMASADRALAPWRQLADPAPGAAPASLAMAGVARQLLVLAGGATSGPEVLRCAIESGLLAELTAAPLRVRLTEIEKRQGDWPQPLLAAHTRALRSALLQAGSATEVELLSTHADACLDIEADWQGVFLAAQGAPLVAALNFAVSPTDSARGLRGAAAISRNLLGQTPAATLQTPLVQAVLQHSLVGGTPESGRDAAAWQGEAGHGLLPLLNAWMAVRASRGLSVPQDPASRLAALQQLADSCLDKTRAAAPAVVQLWGVRADAVHAAQMLAAPGRPALSIWQSRADPGDAV